MEPNLDNELEAIAHGDPVAFGRWMSAAEASVRRSLRPFARHLDAEALLQETFLRIWQVAPRITRDGRPNTLLRLAFVTARNLALSELRRARVSPEELDRVERALHAEESSAVVLSDPLLRSALLACREKLPGKPRAALDQRLGGEGARDDSELAAQLGMTLNTFLQNFTRARKLLAECLRKRGISLEVELR